MLLVVDGEFFEVNSFLWLGGFDEVSDFAFKAHIGDEALAGFCVDARKIASIGVAIRIGVLSVEEEEEVVAVIHDVWLVVGIDIGNGLGDCGFLGFDRFFLGEKFFALMVVAESENALRLEVEIMWKASGGNTIEDILDKAFAVDFCSPS